MEDLITAPFAWCECWEYTLPRPFSKWITIPKKLSQEYCRWEKSEL